VLNVTPDSFSDGGKFLEPARALEQALLLEAEGAAMIDVGGESTRPVGALSLPVAEELARVAPVLELLGHHLRVPFSIDTRKAEVARVALEHGAVMINDVSALSAPAMAVLAAETGCAVVLMHMRGRPENHTRYERYGNVVAEVVRYLRERVRFALSAGISPQRIIVDPGLGFAKNARHNLQLLKALARLSRLGYPILVGASRKRFVRAIAGTSEAEIQAGNAAVHAFAIAGGASLLRVHEAAAAAAVVRMAEALRRGTVV
jgi:dihydropteroate synthase